MRFASGYVCNFLDSKALALYPIARDKAQEDKAASLKMQEFKRNSTVSKILKYFWDKKTQFSFSFFFF